MQLPPPQVTRAVIQRYARLHSRYAADLGVRPLVLPDASFFPDVFHADAPSLERMTRRMQAHAGLRDIPILPVIVPNDAVPEPTGGCSSGACAVPASVTSGAPRLLDEGDGWRIQVPQAELRHPVALTTNLARSLAFIFLIETQRDGESLEPPLDVTADLIAVGLGFGPLLLQGSFMYAKSCGGPQIGSVTKMNVAELAVAVALFAALGGHPLGPALKALDVTQRSLLSEAQDLVQGNRELVELLAARPEVVARGEFELEPPGSFLSNWLKTRRRKRLPPTSAQQLAQATGMDLDELEALMIAMPPSSLAGRPRALGSDSEVKELAGASDPAREELREIVDEALKSMRA